MTIQQLLCGKKNCECGKRHICPIDHVIIERNAISRLPDITDEYKNILLVADKNTFSACGKRVFDTLCEKVSDTLVYDCEGVLVPNEDALALLASRVAESTDLILGVGSGVINDLCKMVSFDKGLPYYIVATATSMDGYASVGSALILDGMKVTKNARVPKAIIADTDVLANAPMDMIRAGYGDIIGKYSCLNDWRLSALVNGEYLCEYVMDTTYDTVKNTVALTDGINARSPEAIGALMEALVAVGILMAYVNNSRPASGSEHHMSHYFEITGIERGEEYLPHGIDVCLSAIETAKLREKLLGIDNIEDFEYCFDKEKYERDIRRIYGAVADEVIALQNKLGWYMIDRVSVYKEKWEEIRKILSDCPTSEEMLSLCQRIGVSYENFKSLYGEEKIADGLLYSKDLKDRYTVLWMYYDLFANKKNK